MAKARTQTGSGLARGASGRIRTCGTWYRKPVLYPLSYGGMHRERCGTTLPPGWTEQETDRVTLRPRRR
jgi:hypothetical protein